MASEGNCAVFNSAERVVEKNKDAVQYPIPYDIIVDTEDERGCECMAINLVGEDLEKRISRSAAMDTRCVLIKILNKVSAII